MASASTALIGSPWLTATHTASGPRSASTSASMRRTAEVMRSAISARDSAAYWSLSGKRAPTGSSWTVRHRGSETSSAMRRPVHAP